MTINPAPQPDPTCALALSRANYWVVPLTAYKKSPPRFDGRTHGEILADNDKTLMDALVDAQQFTATGFALIPQPSDPVPLCILDVDAYGISVEQAWMMLTGGGLDPIPQGTGIVRSASGGWHFWFRLPDIAAASRLPGTWDFGQGRKGEIRASRAALQLILLPGSVAKGKHHQFGRYEAANLDAVCDPSLLAPMPDSLFMRLSERNRNGSDTPDPGGLPTEALKLLHLVHFISEIRPGEQNQCVADLGIILGRIGPWDAPTPELINNAWDAIRDRLPCAHGREPWTFSDFERTVKSGYKVGAKNRKKRTEAAAPTDPSVTDVKAECEAMFGAVPWLVEVVNSKDEFQQYIMGYGGAQTERENATAICSIKDRDLRNILAEISRIVPTADQDILVRSPLFLSPAFGKVLRHMLLTERTHERMGSDPEAAFWDILNMWCVGAAQDQKFLDTVSGPWASLEAMAWIVAPAQDDPFLCLHPEAVERLYRRVGDMLVVKRMLNTHTHSRPLAGRGRSIKMTTISVAHLTEETKAQVRRGYERWVDSRKPKEELEHEHE